MSAEGHNIRRCEACAALYCVECSTSADPDKYCGDDDCEEIDNTVVPYGDGYVRLNA